MLPLFASFFCLFCSQDEANTEEPLYVRSYIFYQIGFLGVISEVYKLKAHLDL